MGTAIFRRRAVCFRIGESHRARLLRSARYEHAGEGGLYCNVPQHRPEPCLSLTFAKWRSGLGHVAIGILQFLFSIGNFLPAVWLLWRVGNCPVRPEVWDCI